MVIQAESFLQYQEENAFKIAMTLNPLLESYLRYVDDSHARFSNIQEAEQFQTILNKQHPAIQYPAIQHPAIQHPAIQHPAIQYPAIQHPAIQHPAIQHPAIQYPAIQHPAIQHPEIQYTIEIENKTMNFLDVNTSLKFTEKKP